MVYTEDVRNRIEQAVSRFKGRDRFLIFYPPSTVWVTFRCEVINASVFSTCPCAYLYVRFSTNYAERGAGLRKLFLGASALTGVDIVVMNDYVRHLLITHIEKWFNERLKNYFSLHWHVDIRCTFV